MKESLTVSTKIQDKTIIIETGKLARQAAGSVTIRMGDTVLLSAVTGTDSPREGMDYFPLQVEYREKFYAVGRFPGGFFKREARPSEKEILSARMTDRPIRPLFPEGYKNEVQINNMLLSGDGENDSDMLSITAASAALTLSEIPFLGPIAGLRVGRVDGEFVINPTHSQRENSDLDLVYVSTRDLPVMIEGGGKEISEKDMVEAMKFAHAECAKLVDAQLELRRMAGLPDKKIEVEQQDNSIADAIRSEADQQFIDALYVSSKRDRVKNTANLKKNLYEKLLEKFPEMTEEQFTGPFYDVEREIVRREILKNGKRVDGRGLDDIRPLSAELSLLPRAHGSALFMRGETQALGTVTLGTKSDTQSLDAVTGGAEEKKFMLHYNFPPYSVGEVGRLGSTNRREIGHGALAERSLEEVMPANFPYTVRVVSDIMGCNGSSSMASICVGSLALMDAGVPVSKAVAGISIGLVTGGDGKAELLTDIVGTEDHCGDMDFKVAGTKDGITGFQVDLKINGLDWALVEAAFEKARLARCKVIDFMTGVIPSPRSEMSAYAPRVEQIKIPVDKIGELIGPGGKNIKRITELSGAQVDIEDDGTVSIYAVDKASLDLAAREVNLITAVIEEGKIYNGVVKGIKEFGAFVEVLPGKEGLVHISELADFRVNSVEDICKLGDPMTVKCIGVDERGRVRLSRKQAMRDKDGKDSGRPPRRR